MENYIRNRSKSELKKLFTNIRAKGISDEMMSDLIELCYNEYANMRTSGFDVPADPDSVIVFNSGTRVFSIYPFDHAIEGFDPRYGIYTWAEKPVFHRIFERFDLQIPDEEGLFLFYFDINEDTRLPELLFTKNPDEDQIKEIYLKSVIISILYFDPIAGEALYFGDDRHGSEWNPQIHWYLNKSFHALRKSGLQLTGLLINQDGSLDAHAQFSVTSGVMFHDDFELPIPATSTEIQILYRAAGNVPRFKSCSNFGIYSTNQIQYNPVAGEPVNVPDGKMCLYHIFATNEHSNDLRKTISVMGIEAYDTLADVYAGLPVELDSISYYMPQSGRCYIGSIIFKCNLAFLNSVKAIVVGVMDMHPPVSIDEDSSDYLQIDYRQILKFSPHKIIKQPSHNFLPGQAIRHDGNIYVLAKANNATNAQTCGIVANVIDADTFRMAVDGYISGDWIPGNEYFLSPAVAGAIITEPLSWEIGEVRQSLGWGTTKGMKVEIDVGDEIGSTTSTPGGGIAEVLTEMSVTGNGTTADKIHLVNDEETPNADSYYGTGETSEKGYHPLPTEAVQALSGANPTFSLDGGRGATITLTENTTITFSNLKANDTGHIQVTQDATGGRTLSFAGANIEIALNSYQAPSQVKLTSVANSKDIVVYWYTGSVMNLAVIFNVQP